MLQFLETRNAIKILKYKYLTIEIQRMWNVKTKVIPVITGATGTISKLLKKYLSNITGKHKLKELHVTATMSTAHILWEVLSTKHSTWETTLHVP
jgi:hypothetical protein